MLIIHIYFTEVSTCGWGCWKTQIKNWYKYDCYHWSQMFTIVSSASYGYKQVCAIWDQFGILPGIDTCKVNT